MNINKIAEIIEEKGYKAVVHEVAKGSTVKMGISLGEGTVRPTIYPDQFEAFELSDDEIADKVIELYKKSNTPNFDTSNIMKEDYVKKKRVCNSSKTNHG